MLLNCFLLQLFFFQPIIICIVYFRIHVIMYLNFTMLLVVLEIGLVGLSPNLYSYKQNSNKNNVRRTLILSLGIQYAFVA